MDTESFDQQKAYWLKFASGGEKNELAKDLHDSWDEESQSYSEETRIPDPALDILRAETAMSVALDFGVGMGRNYGYLGGLFSGVVGFDIPPMIERAKAAIGGSPMLSCDWAEVRNYRFDLVYQSVVFQHMPPQELISRLYDISRMSPFLFCYTRCYNDYARDFRNRAGGVNLAKLVESLDCFEVAWSDCEPAPVRYNMDETHYNILYKSKR